MSLLRAVGEIARECLVLAAFGLTVTASCLIVVAWASGRLDCCATPHPCECVTHDHGRNCYCEIAECEA